jgi:hypothetical protein
MLATKTCLPQVEHIESGIIRDVFHSRFPQIVSERNDTPETSRAKIPDEFAEKQFVELSAFRRTIGAGSNEKIKGPRA